MFEWRNLLQPQGGPSDHREMAHPLQHEAPTLFARLQAPSTAHYRDKTHPPRRGVKHAIISHNVWYKISGRPQAHDFRVRFLKASRTAQSKLINTSGLINRSSVVRPILIENHPSLQFFCRRTITPAGWHSSET